MKEPMAEDSIFGKKIIVVLGMHRSGTSALTRGLDSLSVSLGENLLPPVSGDNDKGFWEDVEFYRINERILAKLGSSWQALGGIDEQELMGDNLQQERDDALSLLRDRLRDVDVFAFKDPRTANILPFWQVLFAELQLDDRYLISVRNPNSVADSLSKRNQIDRQISYCLWMKHQLNAIRFSQGRPRVVVDYDQLMDAPDVQLKRMAGALNLPMPAVDSAEYREYAEAFLSDDLRHYKYGKHQAETAELPRFVSACYHLMQDMADDKIDDQDVQEDERYRNSLAEFSYYPSLFESIDNQDRDLTDTKSRNKALESDNERLETKVATLYSALDRYKKATEKFTELKLRLEESKQTIRSYKELAQKKNSDVVLLTQKLATSKDAVEQARQSIQRYKDVAQAKSADVVMLNHKLAEKERRLQRIENSLSWRVTKPLRYLGYKIKHMKKLAASPLTNALRWVWRKWPWSNRSRQRLVGAVFSKVPFLVSHTRTYQSWLQSQASGQRSKPTVAPVKGVTPKPPNQGVPALPDRVIISCWLAIEDPIVDGLVDIARQLKAVGLVVEFYGRTKFFEDRGELHTYELPLLLSAGKYPLPSAENLALPMWIKDIYSTEMNWRNGNNSLSEIGVQEKCDQAYFYWLDQFTKNRPAYVLVWGASTALSRLHILLCSDLGIPYLVLERGHFHATLLVDSSGHGISSEKLVRPAEALPRIAGKQPRVAGRREEILAWERSVDETVPYSETNAAISCGLLTKLQQSERKLILYIGANDLGSGCTRPVDDPLRCSFLFTDTYAAVVYLNTVVTALFPDCMLLVKPHPSDRRNYHELASDNLMVVDGLNINQLIKLSDVCVSTSTTAFAKCIVEQKPILALATSDISFKNIAYEARDLSSLPVKLRAAVERDSFDSKVESGLAFLEDLFDSSLVALDGKAPTRLQTEDISYLIYQRYLVSASANKKRIVSQLHNVEAAGQARVDVIIPVYGDIETTKRCIESVLSANNAARCRVVIINDASPVAGMKEMLDEFATTEGVELVTNAHNLGFVGTVNRGIDLSKGDVILLNSDTLVTEGWVDRLCVHAYASTDVATVTPFSNNASIFSVRNFPLGFELSEEDDIREFNEKLVSVNGSKAVEVPVGHGFCLFIRRTCLDRVGYFDQLTFGKGYSEEVDFCLRASQLGFRHLCATDTFVAHVGGASFSESADEQRMKNRKIIQQRYPEYFREIKQFVLDDPLKAFRVL